MNKKLRMNGQVAIAIVAGTMSVIWPAAAAQYRLADGDAEIAATISSTEVSRIALRDDRIATMVHLPRGFSVEHDSETGDIFMIPIEGFVGAAPVNLFITSENGHTYQLLLSPLDIPSEQIIISGPRQKSTIARGRAPRSQELARLMRAMITGAFLDDYSRQAPVLSDLDGFDPIYTQLEVLEVWQGDQFRGLRLKIEASNNQLIEAAKLAPGAAAGWISTDGQNAIVVMEASDGE